MTQRYIIEARNPDDSLNLKGRQPEEVFGIGAINGLTEDQIAKIVFQHKPDATLDGRYILSWASLIDPGWKTRAKTW